MGRTGIYACGESVSRRNSLESVALFSLKQEAPASIGGSTFTVIWSKSRNYYVVASELAKGHTKASCTGDKTRRLALAAIAALLASVFPARRAVKTPPVEALAEA